MAFMVKAGAGRDIRQASGVSPGKPRDSWRHQPRPCCITGLQGCKASRGEAVPLKDAPGHSTDQLENQQ